MLFSRFCLQQRSLVLPILCFIYFWLLKHLTLNVGLDNTSIVVLEKLIFLLIIKGLSLLYFCSSHSQEACNSFFSFFVSAFTSLGRHILMKNISNFLRKCLCQDGFRGFIQILMVLLQQCSALKSYY